jgi:hypothetical protein
MPSKLAVGGAVIWGVGLTVKAAVGFIVMGITLGTSEGERLGVSEVGSVEGLTVGLNVVEVVGDSDEVGSADGITVGGSEGAMDGLSDGTLEGGTDKTGDADGG